MPQLVTASVDRIRLQPGTAISLYKCLGPQPNGAGTPGAPNVVKGTRCVWVGGVLFDGCGGGTELSWVGDLCEEEKLRGLKTHWGLEEAVHLCDMHVTAFMQKNLIRSSMEEVTLDWSRG